MISFHSKSKFDKKVTVLLVEQDQLQKRQFNAKDKTILDNILMLSKTGQFMGERDEIFPLSLHGKTILLVGLGKKKEMTLTSLRMNVRRALLSSFLKKPSEIDIIPPEDDEDIVCSILEAISIGTYRWTKYLSSKEKVVFDQKNITVISSKKKRYETIMEIAKGVNLARDLVNDNADKVTSAFMEKTVRELVKGTRCAHLEVLSEKDLRKKGLNLLLAVNQGSRKEPKLIIVRYQGARNSQNDIALIGKGITFDTGGLNLKPTGYIETMRTDMGGAAAVVGTLKNVVALGVKKNILFVLGLAENAIGPGSYKPGDVIKSYSGKTVEIGNTDAEGRLVLADAISYMAKNYKPKKIIDIATLTGACVVALGHDYSGLMSNEEELSRKLLASSQRTDDRLWRLPVYEELKGHIKSQVADMKNIGLPKGCAGTLSAAEFLRQFTEDIPWAHLDIAGTAFVEGNERLYYGYGATGAGVRLLTDYLLNL